MKDITLRTTREGDAAFVGLAGELRMELADRIYQEGKAQIDGGARYVFLDLGGVHFMDSASAGAFIRLERALDDTDGRLVLYGATPAVRKVFRLTGLDDRFEVVEDEAAARALLV